MNIDTLKKQLEAHEGKRLRLYKCTAGKQTIGIGHNIEDKGISPRVCDILFEEDIEEVLVDLKSIFPDFDTLPENIQLVLADMRFQLGGAGIRKFKKMIAAVLRGDWYEMIIQMKDSSWYNQTMHRADDLIQLIRKVAA